MSEELVCPNCGGIEMSAVVVRMDGKYLKAHRCEVCYEVTMDGEDDGE